MPLSWNEIKDRALAFSREWADESSEHAEAKSFWDAFFNVFGVSRRKVATFEEPARRLDASRGYIDLFWKSMLVVEHKSRGKDLDKAFGQAIDYLGRIPERDLPRYVLVSDFARLRLYDLETAEHWEFPLKDLYKQVRRFGFIAGYSTQEIKEQDPVNVKAAERMGRLHDRLKASGYAGHPLEVYLVRLLFCLFADDTGIFQPRGRFRDYLENRTAVDGSDLGPILGQLFQVLNTAEDGRQKTLDEDLAGFAYINGRLFEEMLPLASFDAEMRSALLDCAALDWSRISPAVFGALFQSVMNEKLRRNLGAHYTSEKNILKLIKPLFLDELWAEFRKIRSNPNKLFEFHKRLATLKFMDPACGCGNFLVISYRELRLLELEILKTVLASHQKFVDVFGLVRLDVDQFYGIELEEFPAQIAQVALWLMDHQMNLAVSEAFGMYFARLPLKKSPTIVHGNALQLDWAGILPPEKLSYLLGNPPFVGKKEQSPLQKRDLEPVFSGIKGAGVLDFVAAWYVKAADFIQGTAIRCAFVSTNSITQGEQVGVLWSHLLARGMHIHFAHRTFRWSNEAQGVAAVHCVIIGFGLEDMPVKRLFDYENISGDPHEIKVARINPYLVDAPDVALPKRSSPICPVKPMSYGSMALDNGHLLLNEDEYLALVTASPEHEPFLRRFMGGEEFLNNGKRWCLWLARITPAQIKALPMLRERVEAVRHYRQSSGRAATVKLANFPTLFGENRQPDTTYLLVPKVSSENRVYLPVGLCRPDIVASGSSLIVPDAGLYELGLMSSAMHMAWMRYTCGRLESRYQYSVSIVYNNFPWPRDPEEKHVKAIEVAAQGVLDARARFPGSSLADLYDPLAMPPALTKAHQALDRAVDAAYLAGTKVRGFANDAERVAFLFQLYQQYTSLLPAETRKTRRRKRAS